jgi:hypothetical protein
VTPATLCLVFLQAASTPTTNERPIHWGLTASEWITITALVFGPVLAVVTQFIWQRRQLKTDAKMWILSTLMTHRAALLDPNFVNALNSIDVVFHKNQVVRDRWKDLLDHLNSHAQQGGDFTTAEIEKSRDLLAELLSDIADDLGYVFDHLEIKNGAYYPRGFEKYFVESNLLREKGIAVLEGRANVGVVIRNDPPPPAGPQDLQIAPPRENR